MEVEEVGSDGVYCGRCYGLPDLEVTFADGTTLSLCPTCDEDGPASADALLRFRVEHPQPSAADAELYARLIRDWLDDVCPPTATDTELAAVLESWSQAR